MRSVDLRLQFTQVIAGLVGDFASDVRLDVHLVLAAGGISRSSCSSYTNRMSRLLASATSAWRRKRVTPMAPVLPPQCSDDCDGGADGSWSLQTIMTLATSARTMSKPAGHWPAALCVPGVQVSRFPFERLVVVAMS